MEDGNGPGGASVVAPRREGPTVITNLRAVDGRHVEVAVAAGTIVGSGPDVATTLGATAPTVDGGGGLVLRPLADAHFHLDKAGTADVLPRAAGTLREAIEAMQGLKRAQRDQVAEVAGRMELVARRLEAMGTTAIRAVVDVDECWGLTAYHAARLVKERLAPRLAVRIVVLPQDGLSDTVVGLLDRALEEGADVVGAHTDIDPDAATHLRAVEELATRHDVPVEVHVDEGASPDAFHLPTVLDVLGHHDRVTIVHCLSLGTLPEAERGRWIDAIGEAGFTVAVAPTVMTLGVPLAPVRELVAGGVPVACVSDNLHDVFCPLGTGRPLENARTTALVERLVTPELVVAAVRAATDVPWALVTGERGELAPGTPAWFDVYEAASPLELLRGADRRRLAVRGGEITAPAGTAR